MPNPVAPQWTAIPIAERRQDLASKAAQMFGGIDRPVIRIELPDTPGAQILLNRLRSDWGALGITVERASAGSQADLTLLDAVAPSSSAAWFVRQFRCEAASICDEELDTLLEGARNATVADQRFALLQQAADLIDEQQLFIPIAAPIRWSLVSDRVQGFTINRFARHSLTGLGERLDRNRGE